VLVVVESGERVLLAVFGYVQQRTAPFGDRQRPWRAVPGPALESGERFCRSVGLAEPYGRLDQAGERESDDHRVPHGSGVQGGQPVRGQAVVAQSQGQQPEGVPAPGSTRCQTTVGAAAGQLLAALRVALGRRREGQDALDVAGLPGVPEGVGDAQRLGRVRLGLRVVTEEDPCLGSQLQGMCQFADPALGPADPCQLVGRDQRLGVPAGPQRREHGVGGRQDVGGRGWSGSGQRYPEQLQTGGVVAGQ
jgi:hypothetical protein